LQELGRNFVLGCERRKDLGARAVADLFLVPAGSPSFSNRIVPSTFGELRLNSSPAIR
jgi:hypothetical protein